MSLGKMLIIVAVLVAQSALLAQGQSCDGNGCAAGTYMISCSAGCVACPANFYCTGNRTLPNPCGAGTSTNALTSRTTSTDCVLCANGYTSTEGESCVQCGAGTISSADRVSCTMCPDGQYTTTHTSCSTCAAGTATTDHVTCQSCTSGYECPSQNSVTEVACTPGFYSSIGSPLGCVECVAGDACPATAADWTSGSSYNSLYTCPLGTYSLAGSRVCTPCPARFYCPDRTYDSRTPCPLGSYSAASASVCTTCPAGSYCDNTTDSPIACPPSTFSATGATNCTTCPAGFACPSATSIVACVAGQYSLDGEVTCSSCPAGHYCPSATAAVPCAPGTASPGGLGTCAACATGYYANISGLTTCAQCPAEYYCPDAVASPITCDVGYTSVLGSQSCTLCATGTYWNRGCFPCPAGRFCPDPQSPSMECAGGTYSTLGSSGCSLCPAAMYCPNGTTTPIPCVTGTYSLGGLSTCTSCPADYACTVDGTLTMCDLTNGFYSPVGDATCHLCPAGEVCLSATGGNVTKTCEPGTYRLSGSITCLACPPGYMCPYAQFGPMRCPKGTYSGVAEVACTSCPAGTACLNRTQPIDCIAGTFSTAGDEVCYDCPAGFMCPSTSVYPVPCTSGSYSLEGSTNCTVCPRGFHCPRLDTATLFACAAGTYAAGGASACTTCRGGQYCPSTEFAIEIPCPPGTYSYEGQQSCTACPAAFECPLANAMIQAPRSCPSGSFATGGALACTKCPAGYMCPSTSTATLTACANGTYSEPGSQACTTCTAGYYCPLSAVDSSQPMFGDAGVGRQVACSPGTYSVAGQQFCTRCPQGYYCTSLTGTGGQVSCPSGKLTTKNGVYADTGATECIDCPAGLTCTGAGVAATTCSPGSYTSAGACIPCPAGYECPFTSIAPQICPSGTFATAGKTTCQPCAAGYVCPEGSTTSTPAAGECPSGYYCPSGATSPTLCPAGTYGRGAGGTTADQACEQCDAGKTCPAGTANSGAQISCPIGNYCPAGSPFPTPCPAGTLSTATDATNRATCTLCPEAYFCPPGTSDHTPYPCPPGFFCPSGSASGFENGCPSGTYSTVSMLVSGDKCLSCPPGASCPSVGMPSTVPCSPGTYQPNAGSTTCLPCEEGWACTNTGQVSSYVTACAQGHFCPRGTATTASFPCPAGSYTYRTDLASPDQCQACWRGYACPAGTGVSPNPNPVDCPRGFFCPGAPLPTNGEITTIGAYSGTVTSFANQFQCPKGTYNPSLNAWNEEQCVPCPAGSYCPAGSAATTLLCRAGYYCPEGSFKETQYPCAAGTYGSTTGLTAQSECLPCLSGQYCPEAATVMIKCPAGTYMPFNQSTGRGPALDVSERECLRCPAGYYCPEGTIRAFPCAAGTYSDVQAHTCTTCEAGRYCPYKATTQAKKEFVYQCPAGLYCPIGLDRMPSINSEPCPAGSYCPLGTEAPVQCFPGSYNPSTGRPSIMDCLECPAGLYCANSGLSNVTGECDPGHYCPIGSSSSTQEPCPGRYYRSTNKGETAEFCSVCPAGKYCPEATSTPIACPRGYYCLDGTEDPYPCPIGTFGNATGLISRDTCTACSSGYYCDGLGLPSPTGLCDPGYYCIGRAFSSAPPGLPTGGLCPKGGYCPPGSSLPTACDEGSYNNFTGGSTQQDCTSCTPGYYCAGSNLPFPTGPCAAGYYCTGGSSTPTQFRTPVGYFSLPGAGAPSECAIGTYNPLVAQGACTPCVIGYYCPIRALSNYIVCPAGGYCPAASVLPTACPAGTFQPYTQRHNITNCIACTGGHYCASDNLTAVTGPCDSGYYCKQYCISSTCGRYLQSYRAVENALTTGLENTVGGICPYGKYCESTTTYPARCPIGSLRDALQGKSESDCSACPSRYYCPTTGMSNNVAGNKPILCAAGYYCPGPIANGSNIGCSDATCANHTGEACTAEHVDCAGVNSYLINTGPRLCPSGFYCPVGSSTPTMCYILSTGKSTYQDDLGQATCKLCRSGFWCDPTVLSSIKIPEPCPAGRYCPSGTTALQPKCPIGSWSDVLMLTNSSQCKLCPERRYCPTTGIAMITTDNMPFCRPGYYCSSGAKDEFALKGTLGGVGGICPSGYYCPNGTKANNSYPCPPGTYKPTTFGKTISSCIPCQSGMYCQGTGLSAMTAKCTDGFYCPKSCSDAGCLAAGCMNTSTTFEGGACPRGYYCKGTATVGPILPVLCPEGTYQDEVQQSTCKTCPATFYCPIGTTEPVTCPAGNYCPAGTTSSSVPRCPPGSYNPVTGQSSISACLLCDAGQYCPNYGMNASGPGCNTGIFCTSGAATASGAIGSLGGVTGTCLQGHYCPAGTTANNSYPCPVGTSLSRIGAHNVSMCDRCTAGMYCNSTGQAFPTGPCEPGYYCPASCKDATCSTEAFGGACPTGSYCPQRTVGALLFGASVPTTCPAGTYTDTPASFACKQCTAGNYCLAGTVNPVPCPLGHYCPAGTTFATQYSCPAGTIMNSTGAAALADCIQCPSGHYCAASALSEPTGECRAGYYCTSGAATDTGVVGSQGGVTGACPVGMYCPSGTTFSNQYPCPAGTYQPFMRARNETSCISCSSGFYCPLTGQSSATDKCTAGYYCPRGCADSTCSNKPCNAACNDTTLMGGECPPGYICPQEATRGAYFPTACPAATYSPDYARTTCITCPASYYCPAATAVPIPCPVGRYCPDGTDTNQPKCPPGSYMPTVNSSTVTDCALCPAGKYCALNGNDTFTGLCSAGYYCIEGAMTALGSPGTLGGRGGMCPLGYYCPEGTESPHQFSCPEGTYQPLYGSTSSDNCLPCLPGYYCANRAQRNVTGPCNAGFLCPLGCINAECTNTSVSSDSPLFANTSFGPCPLGSYCPQIINAYSTVTSSGPTKVKGAVVPTACAEGFYTPTVGSSSCTACPAGYYCLSGTTTPIPCVEGGYCPISTGTVIPRCPAGSYSNSTGLSASTQCTICDAGRYCSATGMTESGPSCARGFLCSGGAADPYGRQGVLGGPAFTYPLDVAGRPICPVGAYCPLGTVSPVMCPAGTYNPVTGGWNMTQSCLACDGGKYCPTSGLSAPSGTCYGGYFCPRGCIDERCYSRVSSGLNGGDCPSGHYCPNGTATPIACPEGTTTTSTGASSCPMCPQGFYCASGSPPTPCPSGFYCPEGTTTSIPRCPNGTFSNATMRTDSSACTLCTASMACTVDGLTAPDATCVAGYYCVEGAASISGDLGPKGGTGGVCPSGHYCPAASSVPMACPNGTYNAANQSTSVDDCLLCPAGQYCASTGLSAPSGTCAAGYICGLGEVTMNPPAGACPLGFYCPAGAITPTGCPAGTYNSLPAQTSDAGCLTCPAGKYCDANETAAGTANCTSGWYCISGANQSMPVDGPTGGRCSAGFYCPAGSPGPLNCTYGNYCSTPQLETPDGQCGAGYYCLFGATSSTPTDGITGDMCPAGSYCPVGTSVPQQCPTGTFNPTAGSSSISACYRCDAGRYCPDLAAITAGPKCIAGYFCPGGQSQGNESSNICPAGFYCPAGSAAAIRCPVGQYQDEVGQTTCKSCPSGYYCNPKDLCPGTNMSMPQACPSGYYCPNGTTFAEEFPCPVGTFSNASGLTLKSQCEACTPGHYCSTPHMTAPGPECDAGYICTSGSTTNAPVGNDGGYICPVGSYCPAGALIAVECPAGTFSTATGLGAASECSNCTAGMYCASTGMTAPTGTCSAGYYCPGGQSVPEPAEFICPYGQVCPAGATSYLGTGPGSFANGTGIVNASQCPAGTYCDITLPCDACPPTVSCVGNYTCPRACPLGSYCPPGTTFGNQFSCPIGTYGNALSLETVSDCTKCPTGRYCGAQGMSSSMPLMCAAGFWCLNGSTSARPTDGVTGVKCPSGSYCLAGTLSPIPCPRGTYNPNAGATNKSACALCPVGRACTADGLSAPDALCGPGYFCPGGMTTSTSPQYLCPLGYYCPEGVASPIVCPNGAWTTAKGRDVCDQCPAGFYCNTNETDATTNATVPRLCFPGHYCPNGTSFGDQYPCPIGTFSEAYGVTDSTVCAKCPTGNACPNSGQQLPLPICREGYYCRLGATIVNPTDGNITGDVCPPGYYCPTGTGSPLQCPLGTYSNASGLANDTECQVCPPGVYCNNVGLLEPVGDCYAGYYCVGNNTQGSPTDGICPGGKVCPAGSSSPKDCPNGTYVPETSIGQSTCMACPTGYFCNLQEQAVTPFNVTETFVVPTLCPRGYVCGESTQSAFAIPCPTGTYGNISGARDDTQCVTCPGGYYCNIPGQAYPTGVCAAGYFCASGSNTSVPTAATAAASMGGECPAGNYCPAASPSGIPCPPGTYFGTLGARNASWCQRCLGGYYCQNNGQIVSTGDGPCMGGYYCPGGSQSPADPTYICPKGHYCPNGTAVPVPCPGGSFMDAEGATVCKSCPEFYYCPRGSLTPTTCFNRHVCEANTSYPVVCKNGTYAQNTLVSMNSQSQCVLCPAGFYCSNGTISGPCAAGYFCEYGNSVPDPARSTDVLNVKKGGLCPLGNYCPSGSTYKHPCTNQTVGFTEGLQASTDCSPCRAGYYCLETSIVPIDCPPGYYCPGYVGRTVGLIPCPKGTYQPKYFATDSGYCLPCTAGYFCPTEAASSATTYPAPAGYYTSAGQTEPYPCPGGTYQPKSNGSAAWPAACLTCPVGNYCGPQSSTWNHTCPEGTYCPPGSTYPLHCPGASYCPRNTYNPVACPPGYYCPPRSASPHLCWNGTYCPPSTESPQLCPNGYISRNDTALRLDLEESCQVCPAGTFSTNTLFCESCRPGYVCLGGTTVANPTDIDLEKGYLCPVGHYCPSGSSAPLACPPGTFNNGTGGRSINACYLCPTGFYQSEYAQLGCIRCGKSATSNPGSPQCDCIGAYRSFQPGDSSCRCYPGYNFYEDGQELPDQDSTIDCQPIVYPRCPAGKYRSSYGNVCLDEAGNHDGHNICDFCPNSSGTVDPQIGVCRCTVIQTYEETCDAACLKESSTITVDTSTSTMNYYDPKTGDSSSISLDSSGILGSLGCASGSTTCDVKFMRYTDAGIFGLFDPDFTTIEAGTTAPQNTTTTNTTSSRRRLMQTTTTAKERPIAAPITCLNFGDSMAWDVSDSSREHYPVYTKDSLLNTNPAFDYTAFRDLGEKIRSPNLALTTFVYNFGVPGVYVFHDNYDTSRISVIRVVTARESCPISPYEPFTQGSLVTLGVKRDTDLLLEPDWVLIGTLLGALFLLVAATIFALWLFRRQSWGVVGTALPKYRDDGIDSLKKREFANLASKGSVTKRHQLLSTGEERVSIPPGSSGTMTVRLDQPFESFNADEFDEIVGNEAGIEASNILVLSAVDENSTVVRFVITGTDDPDSAADLISERMSDPNAEIHTKLPIIAFEEAGSTNRDNNGEAVAAGGGAGGMAGFNFAELEDEFWDYERQIDLEGFNVRTLYERLEDQTIHVVSQLVNQRDDLMLLCDKILIESEALKDMFMRIKIDLTDKTQKEIENHRIREEKLAAGVVEFDLPEDIKQVLGQFLEKFFENNLGGIIQNSTFNTNNSTTHIDQIHTTHQNEVQYETIVQEEQADGSVITRTTLGADAYDAMRGTGDVGTIQAPDVKDVDGFKDMFSDNSTKETASAKKTHRKANAPLSPEELLRQQARVRSLNKDIPHEIQDDSDCDDEERQERAIKREALLQTRARRLRRAMDNLTLPLGYDVDEAAEGVMTAEEVAANQEERKAAIARRRAERAQLDTIPQSLEDDESLNADERLRRRLERERLLATRVNRIEGVLRSVDVPEHLRDQPDATEAKRAEIRAKRERYIGQKLEKARRQRAELMAPMELDDDSDMESAERTRRTNEREEIAAQVMIRHPNLPSIPDSQKDGITNEARSNRSAALDKAVQNRVTDAQDNLAARDVAAGLSDHSDLDDATRSARATRRNGGVAGKTAQRGGKAAGKDKKSRSANSFAPVSISEYSAEGASRIPAQYDDDSDLEDDDRKSRDVLRRAFLAGKDASPSVTSYVDENEAGISATEKKHRAELNNAFARGQIARNETDVAKKSALAAKAALAEAEEITSGANKGAFEEGKRREKENTIPGEYVGAGAAKKALERAFISGQQAQRFNAIPEEFDENQVNADADLTAKIVARKAAFVAGRDGAAMTVPAELEDSADLNDTQRAQRSQQRQAFFMGRAAQSATALEEEVEAVSKIDAALGANMRTAMTRAASNARHGINEIPVEYRDDVPGLTSEEIATRRQLQAVYLQALRAQQASIAMAEIEADPTLTAAEKSAMKKAYETGRAAAKKAAPLQSFEAPEEMLAHIRGRQQARAAAVLLDEAAEGGARDQLKRAALAGRSAQQAADELPEEFENVPTMDEKERAMRAQSRYAFHAGRKIRHAANVPTELIEAAQESATSTTGAAKESEKTTAADMTDSKQKELDRLKRDNLIMMKTMREKQKADATNVLEELEEQAIEDAKYNEELLNEVFRREIRSMDERHADELRACADSDREPLKRKQAAEKKSLLDSQASELQESQAEIVSGVAAKRKKIKEILEQRALNEVRLAKTLVNDQDNEIKKMKDDIMLTTAVEDINSEEDLKRYKDAIMDKLKLRERRQKAKCNKEKEFLEAQIKQQEKIEHESLAVNMAHVKRRQIERAKKQFESNPEELEEELERIERVTAREHDAQQVKLNTRLGGERLKREKELADKHAAEKAGELSVAQGEVDKLIAAKNKLKADSEKEEAALSAAQRKAAEMLAQQKRIREDLAHQREEPNKNDAKIKEDAIKEISRREKERGEKLSDAERKKILEEFRSNAAKMDSAMTDEQKRQQDDTKKRLDERRRAKEAAANRKHVEEMTAELRRQEEEQAKKAAELSKKITIKPTEDTTQIVAAEEAKVEAENAQRIADMKARHEEEQRKLEAHLEEELKKVQDKELNKIKAEDERKKRELEAQHRERAAAAMTDEQREELLKSHSEDAKKLEEQIENEAAIQRAKLQDQLEARKRKKKAELAEKQRVETSKGMSEADSRKDDAAREIMLAAEEKAIENAVKSASGAEAQEVATLVMSERHRREVENLLARQARRRQDETTAHEERLESEKEDLQLRLNNRVQFEIDSIPEDHPDREKRTEEIKSKARQMIKDRTPELVAKMAGDAQAFMDQLELEFAEEQLGLKMRQWNDIAKATGVKAPEAVLAKYQARVARGEGEGTSGDDELAQLRKEREAENARAQQKLAQEKAEYEAKMASEMARLKQEQEDELKKREAAMLEELKLERERKEKKLLAARKAAMESGQPETQNRETEDDLKKRLLADYQSEVARVNGIVDNERDRQSQNLESLLRAKKERKKAAMDKSKAPASSTTTTTTTTTNSSAAPTSAIDQVRDAAHSSSTTHVTVQGEGSHSHHSTTNNFVVQQQAANSQAAASSSSGNVAVAVPGGTGAIPAANSPEYQQWVQVIVGQLVNSPIMEKVVKIEKMVASQMPHPLLSYYVDDRDRKIKDNEGRLETIDLSELTTSQFVVYCFAASVRENISRVGIQVPQVKVAIAKTLPDSQTNASAFRNSYHYDHSRRTLFVRDTRLSSIGEFMLVSLHALAHIKSNGEANGSFSGFNDADPAFLTEFYGLLEVCTEEMFYMRLPATLATRQTKEGRNYRPDEIMSAESLSAMEDQLKSVSKSNREAFLKTYLMM